MNGNAAPLDARLGDHQMTKLLGMGAHCARSDSRLDPLPITMNRVQWAFFLGDFAPEGGIFLMDIFED